MTDAPPPSLDATEPEILRSFLDYLRASLLSKLDGLDEDDARRSLVPSGTNLLGLVQHLTAGEYYWFDWVLLADPGAKPDFTMVVPPSRSVADVVADFEAVVRRSNDVLDTASLDQRAARGLHNAEPHTLRWILVHLVEEYARHCGHADILREQLDGETGR